MKAETKKISSLGMEENVACAICYVPVLGVLPAIAFLIVEKSEAVRWNAWQAVILCAAVVAADVLLGLSIVGIPLIPLVNMVGLVVVPLVLAIKANQKEQTRLPILSEVVDRLPKEKSSA